MRAMPVDPGGDLQDGRLRPGLFGWLLFGLADHLGGDTDGNGFGVNLYDPRQEMLLMGRGFDYVPEMFLTDQF